MGYDSKNNIAYWLEKGAGYEAKLRLDNSKIFEVQYLKDEKME